MDGDMGAQHDSDRSKHPVDRAAITVVESPRRARVAPVTPVQLPGDRFIEDGPIAHGGTSEVHQIFDRTLLRRSAMKVLGEALRPFAEDRQRFIEEAQITGQLDHPNIVPVHELGLNEAGVPYFTMKLIEGHTLEAMLATRQSELRRIDWVAGFLEILVKVCDAVAFAHSRGVIHRDLKPGNIMIGTFGQVYVTDWGLARLLEGRSTVLVEGGRTAPDRAGEVLGTIQYMPPEQARGEHDAVDERSDIYALGATLYQVLTGQPPHEAFDEDELLALARSGEVVPPERFATAAKLPRGLCRIAMKALSPDPARRHSSVMALRDDLVAQLRGGRNLPLRTYTPGELIMREGEPGDAAYIILSGQCRAFRVVNGEEVELRHMSDGDVFGETAILSGKPRTASVQAIDQLTVQVVTSEELEDAAGMNTGLGLFVRTLAERFREVDERLIQLETSLLRPEP
jgi:eukaryotic-like serine/threonine-protein kinase